MDVPPLLSKPHFRRAAITLLVLCFASQLVSAAAAAVRDSPSAQHGRKLSSTGKAKLPAVAIIGAGIGGASTAYFLNKMLGGRVIIHVYAHRISLILHDALAAKFLAFVDIL